MKRLIAISLLACMTVFFTGCADSSQPAAETKGQVSIESGADADESSEEESSKEEESSEEESSKEESSKAEESSEVESSEEESSKEESSEPESSVEESSAPESSAAPEPSVEESSEQQQQTSALQTAMGSYGEDDLVFVYNNGQIRLLEKISDALAVLGNASKVESVASCLTIDSPDDKIYYYNGFKVQTLTDSEGEKIYQIEITSNSAATAKGITIGSSTADIENAYGLQNAVAHDEFGYTYSTGGSTALDFFINNGKVENIIYQYYPNS